MNALQALGARIVADVNALITARRRLPLPPPLRDEDLHDGESAAPETPRRVDTAAVSTDGAVNAATPYGWPVQGRLGDHFGLRVHPILGGIRPHRGQDIATPSGTAVVSTAAGRVVTAGRAGTAGLLVEIDHGGGQRTRYMHLSSIAVHVGDRVERGTTIGAVGATGLARGAHLHYEIVLNGRAQDPRGFIGPDARAEGEQ